VFKSIASCENLTNKQIIAFKLSQIYKLLKSASADSEFTKLFRWPLVADNRLNQGWKMRPCTRGARPKVGLHERIFTFERCMAKSQSLYVCATKNFCVLRTFTENFALLG